MNNAPPYDLGVLEAYDEAASIDAGEARALLRQRGGKPACIEVVRRYANPKRGCKPLGEAGPKIVLPSVRVAGQLRFMPQWVKAFVAARAAATRRDLIARAVRKSLPHTGRAGA